MRGRVVERDVAVPALADKLVFEHEDGTDRYFAIVHFRVASEVERTLHPGGVPPRLVSCSRFVGVTFRHRRGAYSHSIVAGGLPLMS